MFNTVRLSEEGLRQLEQLGNVKHIVRLAAFHGIDDPFYQDRYKAKVWSVDAPYFRGFDFPPVQDNIYFHADKTLKESTEETPIAGATYFEFKTSRMHEGIMVLPQNGGVLIAGDSLQNWSKTDRFFSFFAKIMMRWMGFIRPYNIGPGWRKVAKPHMQELRSILDLDFQHVLPAHGEPVLKDAKTLYKRTIDRLSDEHRTKDT